MRRCCCCLMYTSPCSVTEAKGGGVPTSVSDNSEPRLCCLLLQSYYSCPPCRPLLPLNSPQRESPPPVLSCLPTTPVKTPDGIIRPPGRPLSPYHNTYPASSLHGFLRSPERHLYPMTLPRILPSLAVILSLLTPPTATPSGFPSPLNMRRM